MSPIQGDKYKATAVDWVDLKTGTRTSAGAPPPPPPSSLVVYGAYAGPSNFTETKVQQRTRTNASFGVTINPSERLYPGTDFAGVNGYVNNGGGWCITWDDYLLSSTQNCASGAQDANIAAFVGSLPTVATKKFWLGLNHEVDNGPKTTEANHIAAMRRFCDVVHANSGSNVKTCMILQSFAIRGSLPPTDWQRWYAGSNYVDVVGWDGYWRGLQASNWHTADTVFGNPLRASRQVGKPCLIGEHSMGAAGHGGTYLDPAGTGTYLPVTNTQYSDWITETTTYLDAQPDMETVCWFNSVKTDGNWTFDQAGVNHSAAKTKWAAKMQASEARL